MSAPIGPVTLVEPHLTQTTRFELFTSDPSRSLMSLGEPPAELSMAFLNVDEGFFQAGLGPDCCIISYLH